MYAYSPLHNVQPGNQLPADPDHQRRHRRPGRPGPRQEVRRDAASHPDRRARRTPILLRVETQSRPRHGQADQQSHRRARRRVRVPVPGVRDGEVRRPRQRHRRRRRLASIAAGREWSTSETVMRRTPIVLSSRACREISLSAHTSAARGVLHPVGQAPGQARDRRQDEKRLAKSLSFTASLPDVPDRDGR